jgi:hypothetical protein
MIAYRVEVWCDADVCTAGSNAGTVHDDHTQLPGLGRNLVGIRVANGWGEKDGKHYCPKHKAQMESAALTTAIEKQKGKK